MADKSSIPHKNKVIQIGSYHVGKTIGKGVFAVVKMAEHHLAKVKVAIKMIDKSRLDKGNLSKVRREVHVMKLTNHSRIVRLYEVMETERYLYLVTEYASNGEIFELLKKNGRRDEVEARKMFRQIIAAVEYLHQKRIVHRDLKAENLLLDENNRVKLADFGFSNIFDVGSKLKTWCGSPPYAAPELFEGKEYYGPAADIWSMGVVLYVLVCGALPFDGLTFQYLKERVLTGKVRIPYFMSSDCENLIKHMLVVDVNKRYTMNQIKQHKWIIQGEPYEFMLEEDEFGFAQQHCGGENGKVEHNQNILDQIKQLVGEDTSAKVVESLQQKSFDNHYGLYHILLDKFMKEERMSAIKNRIVDDFSHLEFHGNTSPPDSPHSEDVELYDRTFASAKPLKLEIDEGREEELSRYLASSRRRETIAVSHIPETSGRRRSLNPMLGDFGVPEISVCQSPSPTHLNDTSCLQYKEKYLPRPAVLDVRPTFDRRASDSSATLQDSIAQFNLLRSLSKAPTSGSRYGQSQDGSRNMLSVPENEAAGSESDNEQENEAKQYLANRGRQRRTLPTIFPSTPEEVEDTNYHKSFPLRPLKTTNRASPIPYLPATDTRRLSDAIPAKKADEKETIVDVLEEYKKLKDQYSGVSTGAAVRRASNHVRDSGFRHSYPFNDVETTENPTDDPHLLQLRLKQAAQMQNLDVKFMVQKKMLDTQMARQRQDLIRRASEGAPILEGSIKAFLQKHEAQTKVRAKSGTTELQDEMQKLNLIHANSASDLPSFDSSGGTPPQELTGGMDIDDATPEIRAQYNFAGVHDLFQNQESRLPGRNAFIPLSPNFGASRMRPNFGGIDPPPHLWSEQHSLGGSPVAGGGDVSPLVENIHESLTRTMSYDMTFSRNVDEISNSLQHSLSQVVGVEYELSGNTYFSLFKDGIQMEIEIFPLPTPVAGSGNEAGGVSNVKFRRVGGDIWPYKKLRDEIVAGIRL